jgi:metal-sulfur cluster biosynthetic enzyme
MTNDDITKDALAALRDVEDPETGLSVTDLGLIYDVGYDAEEQRLDVRMTFTSPACPAGDVMQDGVERRLMLVHGVKCVNVEVTFDPPWTPARISAEGRRQLGWT